MIASGDGQGQLYVGSVVRSAGQVRVDLQAISPDGVSVLDVGWISTQKLLAIGSQRSSGEPQIFETNVDGSGWSGRSIGPTLPGAPDSVTVALGQLAWVSVNKTVWEQDGRSWTSPTAAAQTFGTSRSISSSGPRYLESDWAGRCPQPRAAAGRLSTTCRRPASRLHAPARLEPCEGRNCWGR